MVASRYADGNVLTAGSLNLSLNNRAGYITGRMGGVTTATGSAAANRALLDYFIASGAVSTNAFLFTQADIRYTNTTTARTAVISVLIGPSGTSPSLTTIGSQEVAVLAANVYDSCSLFGLGSTTVDSATVPAMVRFAVTASHANDITDLRGHAIFNTSSGLV